MNIIYPRLSHSFSAGNIKMTARYLSSSHFIFVYIMINRDQNRMIVICGLKTCLTHTYVRIDSITDTIAYRCTIVRAISGMHLADMSLVAYPSQNPSEATLVGGGRGSWNIYRIYHSGKTQGRKRMFYSAATAISREWIFPIRLPLFSSLLLFPLLLFRRRKMALPLFDLFLHTYLDNSPDQKRREIFRKRECYEYRQGPIEMRASNRTISHLLFVCAKITSETLDMIVIAIYCEHFIETARTFNWGDPSFNNLDFSKTILWNYSYFYTKLFRIFPNYLYTNFYLYTNLLRIFNI